MGVFLNRQRAPQALQAIYRRSFLKQGRVCGDGGVDGEEIYPYRPISLDENLIRSLYAENTIIRCHYHQE